jgi:hypothetical protein
VPEDMDVAEDTMIIDIMMTDIIIVTEKKDLMLLVMKLPERSVYLDCLAVMVS